MVIDYFYHVFWYIFNVTVFPKQMCLLSKSSRRAPAVIYNHYVTVVCHIQAIYIMGIDGQWLHQ